MKPSETSCTRWTRILAEILMWGTPLLLAVPNVALNAMGTMPLSARLANLLLPVGLYLLAMAAGRRTGRTVWLMLPLMVLAAFQIVLLFLYADGSIIGVDMFLNVATTNSSEAMELLGNLLPAITAVVALYLPVLIAGAVAWRHKAEASAKSRRAALMSSPALIIGGAITLAVSYCTIPHYKTDEDLYPVNVISNVGAAIHRDYASRHYHESSAGFTYDAESSRPDSVRELYVAVIGETSRAASWQLNGYDRFTTPRLCAMADSSLAVFRYAMSESNTTHKSVPLLLTPLSATDFGGKINDTKSVITAFNEAGYTTDFISMQARNGSYIEYFASEADSVRYLREPRRGVIREDLHDLNLLPAFDSIVAAGAGKQLIVLHLYGSHFNYVDRYSRDEAYFLPDIAPEANRGNRQRLVNAYDNSIRQTDRLLAAIIDRLDSIGCPAGMIFTSDHGEDIYDDDRNRFLHASPTPTYYQLHVPMLLYFNPELRAAEPEKWRLARARSRAKVSTSATYTPTLLDMAGIDTPLSDRRDALTAEEFSQHGEAIFLNDRNRAEPLPASGFRRRDMECLRALEHRLLNTPTQ